MAKDDIAVNHFNDVSALGLDFTKELQNFFEDYKKLENKTVTFEDF